MPETRSFHRYAGVLCIFASHFKLSSQPCSLSRSGEKENGRYSWSNVEAHGTTTRQAAQEERYSQLKGEFLED
ncbi:MAG: hypothetical protein OEZ35_02775 [Candidatus Bathyarchaeota archaeon]|nr:hypothetical protein [Candidatus Bathyarchaeota archaeon]